VRSVWILACGAAFSLAAGAALVYAFKPPPRPRNPNLFLEAIPTQARGTVGKPFPVVFRLVNRGTVPLLVLPEELGSVRARITVLGPDALPVRGPDYAGRICGNAFQEEPRDFIRLEAGQGVAVRSQTTPLDQWRPSRPGRHVVTLSYDCRPPDLRWTRLPWNRDLIRDPDLIPLWDQVPFLNRSASIEVDVDP
jgi:hypothetical protein